MTRRVLRLLAIAFAAVAAGVATSNEDDIARAQAAEAPVNSPGARSPGCPSARLSSHYVKRVWNALRSRRDLWGAHLLAAPNGPTYERAQRYLTPLLLARTQNGRKLTASGVHYTHFSQPSPTRGATSVALHVADGSQIISRRSHGRNLRIAVGVGGRERYGFCLRRLGRPRLRAGYLPVLQTQYVDRHGVRYRQESFATRIPETRSLVSFVKLTADATQLARSARAGSLYAVHEAAHSTGHPARARRAHVPRLQ